MEIKQYSVYHDKQQQMDNEKVIKLKSRLQEFSKVKTISEAKELAKKILPVSQEITKFRVGNARCTIINKEFIFRVTLDTELEFISYDFI